MANADLPVRGPDELLRLRLRPLTTRPPRRDGRYVLYWMQQQRRLHHNHALQHAVARAREHGVALLVYEALRVDYPHASDRHHHFACQAMLEHRDALAGREIGYLPYVEPTPGAGRGLVAALLEQAVEVVTDEVPAFIVPGHNRALARLADDAGIRATAVDACGLLPVRLLEEPCPTAAVFRRYVHKHARAALIAAPQPQPVARPNLAPFQAAWLAAVQRRWGDAHAWLDRLEADPAAALGELPIDHGVPLVPARGGRERGRRELRSWIAKGLPRYAERNHPDAPASSGLSPYLHWGMLSTHEILAAVFDAEGGLDPEQVSARGGAREGFWPLSAAAQAFLDQVVTWRELGFHTAALVDGFERYASLPAWARETLTAHRDDERPAILDRSELEAAASPDAVWNAAQSQLRQDGHIHNHLRMLWGKLVLAWKRRPEDAYADLIHLNNKWGLDGRDPNSWSGVLWCFGRYDRPWQERAIYGKVRFMTSAQARKKLRMEDWIERYGA